jgi:hypothetical protein
MCPPDPPTLASSGGTRGWWLFFWRTKRGVESCSSGVNSFDGKRKEKKGTHPLKIWVPYFFWVPSGIFWTSTLIPSDSAFAKILDLTADLCVRLGVGETTGAVCRLHVSLKISLELAGFDAPTSSSISRRLHAAFMEMQIGAQHERGGPAVRHASH